MQLKQELKNTFTSYWHYFALQVACKNNIFDLIQNQYNTAEKICSIAQSDKTILQKLLDALFEFNYISINEKQEYSLTEKGMLLTENNENSLKNACILWGEEHLTAWQNIDYTLKTGNSSFENLYKTNYFKYLQQNQEKLKNYHLALQEYAKDDYKNITEIHDFSKHNKIIDVGGSLGILMNFIKTNYPYIDCYVFDLEEVIQLANCKIKNRINFISGNFFENIPEADGIILSKILHDWDDDKAITILQNCNKSLDKNGNLYIIETNQNIIKTSLLILNMAVMCKSHERNLVEYQNLLQKTNFQYIENKQINDLYTLIIAKKNELARHTNFN